MSEAGGQLPSADTLVRQAVLLRSAGAMDRAVELLKETLGRQPDHLNAQIQLAATYIDHGKKPQALDVLEVAKGQAPDSAAVRRLCALASLPKRARRARDEAEAAVNLEPNNGAGHTILGLALARLRRLDAAEAALRRGVELAPGTAFGHVQLGHFLLQRRRPNEAAVVSEAAARIDPENVTVITLRGTVAFMLGKTAEARDFALWALSRNATSRGALTLLVGVKTRQQWMLGLWWRLALHAWARVAVVAAVMVACTLLFPNLPTLTLETIVGCGLLLYLGSGRVLLRQLVQRELRSVRLKPSF